MKKIAVTFTSTTNERLEKIKQAAPGYEVIQMKADDEQILECEIIFGSIKPALIAKVSHLKWLHTFFAGVDSLLKPEVNFPGNVVLTNSAGTYGIGISEYLLATTLMLMRRNIEYAKLQFANKWERLGEVKSIYGSKVCVVGLGDLGDNYAKRCKALGATVVGVVRTARATMPDSVDSLYTIDQLDEAIADADVVALCLPGTSETKGLFDEARINKMKPGALILNVGRGTAIDTEALIAALDSGQIGGAGLDVTAPEPLPEDSCLWQRDNVVITPHISGNQTLELTNDLIVDKFVTYLQDYVAGRDFERVVNKDLGY
ncbi:MAG: D-2-hydroxyacid dehydrogenase [Turicibacter sp.]|nr:D-2-hydroxyacid dehydrogenase [Turicibacter sp.]